MAERIVIRQDSNFQTRFWAEDESGGLREVAHLQDITPYGMLLAGLGSCTGVVVHTYAQYHDVDLYEVELDVAYERNFREDCERCEGIDRYTESITQDISFTGDLTPEEREKLFRISLQCPIDKMLKSGVRVESRQSKPAKAKPPRAKEEKTKEAKMKAGGRK
jgi:uncharacterized OsmC-like protein